MQRLQIQAADAESTQAPVGLICRIVEGPMYGGMCFEVRAVSTATTVVPIGKGWL